MLSISTMSSGQGNYYAALAREDYYVGGGEPPGLWMGKGAARLGLTGKIDRKTFLDLFAGQHKGKNLVQRAGTKEHRPGWDLTFSAPKSVSAAWSQADPETAHEMQAAHLSAVEKAVTYLEGQALWTRLGKGGLEYQRCEALVATFEHGTSRAQDPQLHTHALLLNIGVTADGKTRSIETRDVYLHKMAAGALYRAELAHQFQRRFGFTIVRKASCFELEGGSRGVVRRIFDTEQRNPGGDEGKRAPVVKGR